MVGGNQYQSRFFLTRFPFVEFVVLVHMVVGLLPASIWQKNDFCEHKSVEQIN
jgi:hypothetical protein